MEINNIMHRKTFIFEFFGFWGFSVVFNTYKIDNFVGF